MRSAWFWVTIWCCTLGLTTTGSAQNYNSAEYVRGLYYKYLGREPSTDELTQWVWAFQKGTTLADAQQTFLSSEDYFTRCGRNPNTLVAGLYTEILNRVPTQAEAASWVGNYNTFRGDRQRLAREFIKAAQLELNRRQPLQLPATTPREGQLSVTASLLRDALEDEVGGTPQGRQLLLMSRNLVNASRSFDSLPVNAVPAREQAYRDVGAAVSALQGAMGTAVYSAPSSGAYLDRFLQIYRSQPGFPAYPGGSSSAPSYRPSVPSDAMTDRTYNAVLQANTALSSDTQQLLYMLRNAPPGDLGSQQLLRDVEYFFSQVDALDHSVGVGSSMSDVRSRVMRMRSFAGGITQTIRQVRPTTQIVGRWNMVTQELQQLGSIVGVSMDTAIDPYQPVLLDMPTYSQFPYSVQRPRPPQVPYSMVPTVDRAVGEMNAFIVGYNQYLPYEPQVASLQAQARALRMTLLQLRQDLSSNADSRTTQKRMAQVNQQLQTLTTNWQRILAATQLTGTPDLLQVTLAIQQLNENLPAGSAG